PQQAEVRGRGGLHQRANEVPEPPAAHASMRAAANPALTLIVNAPNNVPIPMIPANASRWTRSSLTSVPTATKTAVPATEPKNKETLRRAVPGSRARVNRAKSRGPNRLGGVARDGPDRFPWMIRSGAVQKTFSRDE